jgi:glycosyltransferase involved in cell wall biosynthesis
MTPPVIACVPVWIYAKLTGAQYAIDAHSGAFIDGRWTWALFIHRFFSRHAVATIVTGDFLANIVRRWGANAEIVTDVPVCFAEPGPVRLEGDCNMTFISTFTRDEPLEIFLQAAALTPDVSFHVTGRLKDANPAVLKIAPANVVFTDYLSDASYVGLLLASDAVICLTTADHTMQRGAYEAVYLGRPVITSDYDILRKSFHTGTVHVRNTPEDIARGVREMKNNLHRYQDEVSQLRVQKLHHWRTVEESLDRLFGRRRKYVPLQAREANRA